MEMRRDDFDFIAELRALRPSPNVAFTEELDARVAAGFAKTGESEDGLLGRIAGTLRNSSPRRLMLPAGAVALTALVVATAVIAISETGNDASAPRQVVDAREGGEERLSGRSADPAGGGQAGLQYSDTPANLSGGHPPTGSSASGVGKTAAAEPADSSAGYQLQGAPPPPARTGHRAVERDAELVLLTRPGEIGEASKEVFSVVHGANGVVLSSSVRDQGGESSARFQLLVPSTRLGDTLASLSQIAEVRSRHESTLDITAPTVNVGDRLEDSEATIEGMLAQLGTTESYEDRALLERQLRRERQGAAALRSQLDQLQRRADFARISLRIESGSDAGAAGAGRWGVADALRDAGHILTIAAGVVVIGLAVLGPLLLIALLAWLTHRAWRQQRRQRALG